MRITILTLFPEMFEGPFKESIIKRAIENKYVVINIVNFRDYSKDPHHNVDDEPFGGGAGMVLMCDPIVSAINAIKTDDTKVILLTPSGIPYKESIAYDFSKFKDIIIICGHYEGFDERILDYVDYEISIGDYVLTGGEIPAMAMVDSIVRLIPGVIKEESHINDSFNDNLLDYPTYTHPRVYNGVEVPEVLLSGNHQNIAKWRQEMQYKKTKEKRPDLLD